MNTSTLSSHRSRIVKETHDMNLLNLGKTALKASRHSFLAAFLLACIGLLGLAPAAKAQIPGWVPISVQTKSQPPFTFTLTFTNSRSETFPSQTVHMKVWGVNGMTKGVGPTQHHAFTLPELKKGQSWSQTFPYPGGILDGFMGTLKIGDYDLLPF